MYKYDKFEKFLKENLDIGKDDNSLFGDLDLLCTNVPYGSIKNKDGKEYWIYYDYPARLETNSLRDCIDLLKPKTEKEDGGVGIIIIPSGILETNENIEVRKYLVKNCNILGIVSLPKYTFAPYTTQKTYVLIIQKKSEKEITYFDLENYKQEKKTFIYMSDVDGKAQSDKRYEVNRTTNTKFGVEWLHNDFKANFGKYDGVYLSKIERCWDFFELNINKDYNQDRLTADWNGKEWEKTEGKKWGGFQIKSIKKTMFKDKELNKPILIKLELFLKNNKLNFDTFLKNNFFLQTLENYKIKNGKKEKLLFSASDFILIKQNLETFFINSEKKVAYLEKKDIFDFNIRPEEYLIDKKTDELTLEDIKSQLNTL